MIAPGFASRSKRVDTEGAEESAGRVLIWLIQNLRVIGVPC